MCVCIINSSRQKLLKEIQNLNLKSRVQTQI